MTNHLGELDRLYDEAMRSEWPNGPVPAKWHDTMMDDLANYLQARKGEQ